MIITKDWPHIKFKLNTEQNLRINIRTLETRACWNGLILYALWKLCKAEILTKPIMAYYMTMLYSRLWTKLISGINWFGHMTKPFKNEFCPADIYLLKVDSIKMMCEICSKLAIKIPERHFWCRFGVFIVNFEQISHIVLLLPLLTLNK